MKRTVYTWMLTLLTVFGATVASADEKVSFEVKAPMVVAKGEAVRVEFSLNASPDEGSFTAPSFEGFDVIAGPAFSQGSSIQIVNGQMTRSSNYTITYVLCRSRRATSPSVRPPCGSARASTRQGAADRGGGGDAGEQRRPAGGAGRPVG